MKANRHCRLMSMQSREEISVDVMRCNDRMNLLLSKNFDTTTPKLCLLQLYNNIYES